MKGITEGQMVVTDRWGIALVVRAIQGGTYILATEAHEKVVWEIATEDSIISLYQPPVRLLELFTHLYDKVAPT